MTACSISRVQADYLHDTLGMGTGRPRLSWQIETSQPNWQQSAYQIKLAGSGGKERASTEWVKSQQSLYVGWPFESLHSREQAVVQVRVRGEDGRETGWSDPLSLEVGLLSADDWTARFITPTWEEDPTRDNPAPYVRRSFSLREDICCARLYISALGVYEARINGEVVGDQVLAPGWTVYDRRIRYQTFDVTGLLRAGENGLGAMVGDGWYRGRLGFGEGRRNIYGDRLALLAQLEVEYEDGSSERIITDEGWRASTGPIRASSLYDGEDYDARLELTGWSKAKFNDDDWKNVRIHEQSLATLEAPLGPPVRRIETLSPLSISQSPSGKTLVDFGQNLVGRLAIRVKGEAGQTVTFRHAEVLEEGELGTRPLRGAKATDRYTLRGGSAETYEPIFTFHGFRYVEVEGWPGELQPTDISAVVIHSDMERTGWFECSDPMLNQFHQNVVWGMRGNFLDVPTDCPQRDERMGWTGDIQVFSPTASFLFDVRGFLQSWLCDLAVEQEKRDGEVPHVVPDILDAGGAAAWGDAAVVVPWVIYQRYGDWEILEAQFSSMCDWVDTVAKIAGDDYLWDTGFQFGDWLDPTAPPDNPFLARTDKRIVSSAYFAYSAGIIARVAELMGRGADHEHYAAIAERAREAFVREYVTPAGRLMGDAETAYALALMFELLPTAEQRRRAGDRLAELVWESGYRIRTGFVGTPLICDALSRSGHYRTAYRLLRQQECPSWLYSVVMGATTVWERWDAMLPDGSINPGEMTSFNHYALGAVADWMHRVVGGIAPAEAGYSRLIIAPRPGGGLSHCRTKLHTPYGPAACEWSIDDETIDMQVTVPPNTRALVTIPGTELEPVEVGSGQWSWSSAYRDPDERGPYTVDDPIGEILVDQSSRDAVLRALQEVGAAGFLTAVLLNEPSMTLRELIERLPDRDEAVAQMNRVLAEFPTT